MTNTFSATEAAEIQRWINHTKIAELISRYAKLFDERDFSATLPTLFTEDAHIKLPPGDHRGICGLDAFHLAVMAPFGATQHIFTNMLIDIDNDRASFRANTYVTHVILPFGGATTYESDTTTPLMAAANDETTIRTGDGNNLFLAGGVLHGTTVRTSDGWRIQQINLDVVWRYGDFGYRPESASISMQALCAEFQQ